MFAEFNLDNGDINFSDDTKPLLTDYSRVAPVPLHPYDGSIWYGGAKFLQFAQVPANLTNSTNNLVGFKADDNNILQVGSDAFLVTKYGSTQFNLDVRVHLQDHIVNYEDAYISTYDATGKIMWSASAFITVPRLIKRLEITKEYMSPSDTPWLIYNSPNDKPLYLLTPPFNGIYDLNGDGVSYESSIQVKWENNGKRIMVNLSTGRENNHYNLLMRYGYVPVYVVQYP
ncbi:hypothetical protein ABTD75_00515 [Acinetobacter baumannii]